MQIIGIVACQLMCLSTSRLLQPTAHMPAPALQPFHLSPPFAGFFFNGLLLTVWQISPQIPPLRPAQHAPPFTTLPWPHCFSHFCRSRRPACGGAAAVGPGRGPPLPLPCSPHQTRSCGLHVRGSHTAVLLSAPGSEPGGRGCRPAGGQWAGQEAEAGEVDIQVARVKPESR